MIKSGTLQGYRKRLRGIGKKKKRDGAVIMKPVEYWAFVVISEEKTIKIRVILKRIGDEKTI